jgi:hypothetical protein
MKIRPVGVELIHSDGQMDGRMDGHDEANSCFQNFANASKIGSTWALLSDE